MDAIVIVSTFYSFKIVEMILFVAPTKQCTIPTCKMTSNEKSKLLEHPVTMSPY